MIKKITFLMLLLPVYIFAQDSWTFDTTDEGWTRTGFEIGSPITGSVVLTTSDGSTNPQFKTTGASIDASSKTIAAVTIKVGDEGPQEMRVSFLKLSTENLVDRVYKNIDISKGDSEFRTYYVDCTHADWTGTISDLRLHFRGLDGADYTGTTSTDETVEIDKIEFLSAIPITEKNAYYFESDNYTEGWEPINGAVSVADGDLVFIPNANSHAKFEQTLHSVHSDNNYIHMRISNQSANDKIRLNNGEGLFIMDIDLDQNQAEGTYTDYDVQIPNPQDRWPGGTSEGVILQIRNTSNTSNKATAGTVSIDYIVFNASALSVEASVKEQLSISVYPNPVNSQLNIASEKAVKEVRILNSVGKLVAKGNSAQLATDALPAGVYLVTVVFEDGQTLAQKIIKE